MWWYELQISNQARLGLKISGFTPSEIGRRNHIIYGNKKNRRKADAIPLRETFQSFQLTQRTNSLSIIPALEWRNAHNTNSGKDVVLPFIPLSVVERTGHYNVTEWVPQKVNVHLLQLIANCSVFLIKDPLHTWQHYKIGWNNTLAFPSKAPVPR